MKFNISGFTHKGSEREINQDSILVGNILLNDGVTQIENTDFCCCFVADGVGGNKAGDFASRFVLESIYKDISKLRSDTNSFLTEINLKLLESSRSDPDKEGCASTLSGLIIQDEYFQMIHVGDSEIWLLRNEMFFKVTNDQVLDEDEENSPITSYFGGNDNYLKPDAESNLSGAEPGDVFMICSDGILKTLNAKMVKSILQSADLLTARNFQIRESCLNKGAHDNISSILIQCI